MSNLIKFSIEIFVVKIFCRIFLILIKKSKKNTDEPPLQ